MGAAAVPIFIGLMAAGSIYAGYQKKQAGLAQKYEYQARARQEQLAARDREIERKQKLLQALSQRSAQFSTQGTSFEGSPGAILSEDFRQYELDRTTAIGQDAATQAALRGAGKNAAAIGRMGMVGGILEAGGYIASMGLPETKTKTP